MLVLDSIYCSIISKAQKISFALLRPVYIINPVNKPNYQQILSTFCLGLFDKGHDRLVLTVKFMDSALFVGSTDIA